MALDAVAGHGVEANAPAAHAGDGVEASAQGPVARPRDDADLVAGVGHLDDGPVEIAFAEWDAQRREVGAGRGVAGPRPGGRGHGDMLARSPTRLARSKVGP